MKRYFLKSALLIMSMATLISCDEDTVTYGGKNFVSFERVSSNRITFFEHLGVSEIPVDIAFPVNHDITVKFTVASQNAVENVDYIVPSYQVVIPAGATSANIKIQVIDNEVMNDSKALELTLTEISDSSVTVGLADAGSKFKRFLIVNDDCTTNFFDFVGQFYATSSGSGALGIAEVDVNDNGDCNIIRVSGPIVSSSAIGDFSTDDYIEFTMKPASLTNPNSGSISAVQQAFCSECFTYEDVAQTLLFTGSGTFLNSPNATTPVTRLIITGNIGPAGNAFPAQSTSVTLTKIRE